MNCKCLEDTNAKLREMNLKLVGYTYLMPSFRVVPTVQTDWIDADAAPKGKKRKPTQMLATHCPFCGTPVAAKEGAE